MCKAIIFLFIFFPICCYSTEQDEYNKQDAIKYAIKGISKEFNLDARVKQLQQSTTRYLENNVHEYVAYVPSFLIGSSAQLITQKELKFKGKTPYIGNRYELAISKSELRLKLIGQNPFADKSKYWMTTDTKVLQAGLDFDF